MTFANLAKPWKTMQYPGDTILERGFERPDDFNLPKSWIQEGDVPWFRFVIELKNLEIQDFEALKSWIHNFGNSSLSSKVVNHPMITFQCPWKGSGFNEVMIRRVLVCRRQRFMFVCPITFASTKLLHIRSLQLSWEILCLGSNDLELYMFPALYRFLSYITFHCLSYIAGW